ncbi:ExbD/TolR family protein [Bythopirellula polymerisocia]|uniref:Biopolymer transport protein ExbD/TolR n=1 Tax=Bythopirellula polymerisocia TaxID=2528003 RepID=A0A5C6CTR1_9BACT|nr:biopolymer transporter ExbD [Bythopirellula polymerisocia]TWU27255.1 Biopolymer transport protein ExbD/TolR [Bythopirellula polymerisocia]
MAEEVHYSEDAITRHRSHRGEDEMDLTPMVDVTFLLLIFFMITAAFALQKSLEIPPVKEQEGAVTQTVDDLEKDSIVVRVDEDNVFWISGPSSPEEQRATSAQEMIVKLRKVREESPSGAAKMLVQANGDARHEFVVAALDAGTGVGMEEIRLMSYEEGDFDF